MPAIRFDVKVGNRNQEGQPEEISSIQLKAVFQHQQIQELYDNVKSKLKVSKVPLFLLQVPEKFPVEKVPLVGEIVSGHTPESDYSLTTFKENGINFYVMYLDKTNDQFILFVKKVQKVFGPLTKLKNEFVFSAHFFQIKQKINKFIAQGKKIAAADILFDYCDIGGQLIIDNQFFNQFQELVKKISPKFANSPMMALAPVADDIQVNLNFDSINELSEEFKVKSLIPRGFDEEMWKITKDSEEKIKILMTFSQLGYLELSVPLHLMPFLVSLNF